MPTDSTKMWNWDKSLSNCHGKVSSIKYQNCFGCAIKIIHQEHPQIDRSYIYRKNLKYSNSGLDMLPRVQITSHMILFEFKKLLK